MLFQKLKNDNSRSRGRYLRQLNRHPSPPDAALNLNLSLLNQLVFITSCNIAQVRKLFLILTVNAILCLFVSPVEHFFVSCSMFPGDFPDSSTGSHLK